MLFGNAPCHTSAWLILDALQKGDVLLRIPRTPESVIAIDDLVDTPIGDLYNDSNMKDFMNADDITNYQHLFLAMFLIWHRRMGSESPYAYYLDYLPSDVHCQAQFTRAVRGYVHVH